jgi:hypothetical protein
MKQVRLRRVGPVVLLSLLMGWATAAQAAAVLLVRPVDASQVIAETLVRLSGELLSVGFETEVVEGPAADGVSGSDWRGWLERLAAEREADAVVALVGDAAPTSIKVWIVDKVAGNTGVRTVPFDATREHASETLAIRALELLRSSLLEIELAAREKRRVPLATPPTAVVENVRSEKPTGASQRFGLAVGGAGVVGVGGVGPAILPMVRFTWAARPSFVANVAMAGLGTRPTVESQWGSAQVTQAYAVLGGDYRFRVGHRLRPFLTLSAGALYTAIKGRAGAPNQGSDADTWSFLLDGGLGAWVGLSDRFFLEAAAHAQLAEPYPAIRFGDAVVATTARPNLLLTLTIGAWL